MVHTIRIEPTLPSIYVLYLLYFGKSLWSFSRVSDLISCNRTSQLLASTLPTPPFFPDFHYTFNPYMSFEINWSTIVMGLYLAYYYALEPLAAVRIYYFNLCTMLQVF